jgi:microsomal dipeptidase-like Zn-dependent dipeptidase
MKEAKQRGSIALLLGLEGGHALEGRIDNLVRFHREGLRWLGLTWNGSNELGDGCGETVNGGLTAFGREVVLTANRLGILVDLSHTSRATSDDAVRISRAPTIASHSNAATLCSHPRNLTDEQIHKIARHGGVIGVNFFPALLVAGRPPTGHDILAHIRHITRLAGCGHVALGPDFVGPGSLETLQSRAESRGVDYGEHFHYPPGFSDEGCFPRVERLMADMGMKHVDVSRIMGNNVMRVLREVERESGCLRQACP